MYNVIVYSCVKLFDNIHTLTYAMPYKEMFKLITTAVFFTWKISTWVKILMSTFKDKCNFVYFKHIKESRKKIYFSICKIVTVFNFYLQPVIGINFVHSAKQKT